jgi:hypothetical protein
MKSELIRAKTDDDVKKAAASSFSPGRSAFEPDTAPKITCNQLVANTST